MKKLSAFVSTLALIPATALADGGYSDGGDVDGIVIIVVLGLIVAFGAIAAVVVGNGR